MRRVTGVSLFLVACVVALAQDAGNSGTSAVTIQVAEDETYGKYLVDGEGRSLYVFSEDAKDTSTCTEQCAENWPPLTIEGEPTAGEGVAGSLLGTIKRQDGQSQVTYSGLPLYYFVEDENPGDTNGQGFEAFEGVFSLVSPYGVAVQAPEEQAAEAAPNGEADQEGAREVPTELLSAGEEIFSRTASPPCASCHGQNGEGGVGPKLAGNDRLSDQSLVIRQILRGGQFMPSFGEQLSDQQVAAVATYVRNAWENNFGAVTEEEVSQAR